MYEYVIYVALAKDINLLLEREGEITALMFTY